jgi:hypothetical protein
MASRSGLLRIHPSVSLTGALVPYAGVLFCAEKDCPTTDGAAAPVAAGEETGTY